MRFVYTTKTILTNLNVLERFVDTPLVLSVCRVEVIFYAIIRPTGQLFSDVGPLVSKSFV